MSGDLCVLFIPGLRCGATDRDRSQHSGAAAQSAHQKVTSPSLSIYLSLYSSILSLYLSTYTYISINKTQAQELKVLARRLSIHLSIYVFFYLSIYLYKYIYIYMISNYQYVKLYIFLPSCLSLYPSIFNFRYVCPLNHGLSSNQRRRKERRWRYGRFRFQQPVRPAAASPTASRQRRRSRPKWQRQWWSAAGPLPLKISGGRRIRIKYWCH